MIARLRGTVVETTPTHVVVDVGGVGYLVSMAHTGACTEGSEVALTTYLVVRENALDLYGFHTEEEKRIFELLLKLPKIGPKSAIGILAQADIALLKKSVSGNDPSYLSKMSGIGKKSAEKIVLGLKDLFDADEHAAPYGEEMGEAGDVIDALVALGYSPKDAREALRKIPEGATTTNERVREALKTLGS